MGPVVCTISCLPHLVSPQEFTRFPTRATRSSVVSFAPSYKIAARTAKSWWEMPNLIPIKTSEKRCSLALYHHHSLLTQTHEFFQWIITHYAGSLYTIQNRRHLNYLYCNPFTGGNDPTNAVELLATGKINNYCCWQVESTGNERFVCVTIICALCVGL